MQATVYPAGRGKARISFAYHLSSVLHRITSIAAFVPKFAANRQGAIAWESPITAITEEFRRISILTARRPLPRLHANPK